MSLPSLLLCFAVAWCAGTTAWAQPTAAAAPPIADFFRRPALQSPKLSPDGSRIAMLVPGPEGRTVLAVADVATPNRRIGIARFSDADVRDVHWVNDKRLVFGAVDFQAPLGAQFGSGLYAVDADGENFVWLVGRGLSEESKGHVAIRPLRGNHALFATLRDGSDDVLVERINVDRSADPGSRSVLRLNTHTRALGTLVSNPPDEVSNWVLDRQGVPRAAFAVDDKGQARVWWRGAADQTWVQLGAFDIFDPKADSFTPVAIEADGQLLVRAVRDDPGRTFALFRFDLPGKRIAAQPVVALKGFDVGDSRSDLVFDRASGQLLGMHYLTDARGTAWLHPAMVALQERVDKLLPQTANVLLCESCLSQRRAIVLSWSDRQSPVFFMLDRDLEGKAALMLLGPSRPWIDAARMAEQDFVRIAARDGLSLPATVTKPQGKGPWPTVVLVHGGPWARNSGWGWEPDAQFLASRGYLVLQPEFRGSVGFGDTLFRAGFKQWGLAMQDDITDATRWAIAQGLADPGRIAIAGASYGGYATMMGLVKEPGLYRAGINWVGVTDIDLMYAIDWSDAGDLWQRYGMPRMVGDRSKDKAQLSATSPLQRAAEITRPVLMAYGTKDIRVPLPHGTRMRDALLASGKAEVEWVAYEDEGHGFLLDQNQLDFWGRVERFLARHLR